MKIQAVMMMKNDVKRMQFTLDNFFKHNPEIPVTLYNCGGLSPSDYVQKYSNLKLVEYEDIWHKNTHDGVGSFDPRWFDIMFKHGLDENFTHLLFLETDVLTTKKISITPRYDMSGILNYCGEHDKNIYNYLNLSPAPHSGCGSTIYTKNFFKKTYKNLYLVEKIFNEKQEHFFSDLIITILGRLSQCSYGHWEECSDLRGYLIKDNKNNYIKIPSSNYSTTFVHSLKV